MDINRIDEKNLKDPPVIEMALIMLPALLNMIQIIQIHENNRYLEKNLENKNQFDKVQNEISNLQNISDQIMNFLVSASSQKNFNLNAKVSIKDTLILLKRDDYFRWMQLERTLKKVDVEIYNLKYDLRTYAIRNNLNLDINVNDDLIKNLDSLILNKDDMNFADFITGLTDSISEISKRLADLGGNELD